MNYWCTSAGSDQVSFVTHTHTHTLSRSCSVVDGSLVVWRDSYFSGGAGILVTSVVDSAKACCSCMARRRASSGTTPPFPVALPLPPLWSPLLALHDGCAGFGRCRLPASASVEPTTSCSSRNSRPQLQQHLEQQHFSGGRKAAGFGRVSDAACCETSPVPVACGGGVRSGSICCSVCAFVHPIECMNDCPTDFGFRHGWPPGPARPHGLVCVWRWK